MENTYWNGNGEYQADYKRLVELMPAQGEADTLAGELIRCVSRLGHELYNNGMGNNSSGAANFLLEHGAIDLPTWETIFPYTRGRLYPGNYNGDICQRAVESAVDQTIQWIKANDAITTPNKDSMFNHESEEQHFCEECDDEIGMWGNHLCENCEQAFDEEHAPETEDDNCYCC